MSFLKIQKKSNTSIKSKKNKKKSGKTVQKLLDIKIINEKIIQGSEKSKYFIRVTAKNINIMTENFLLSEINNLKSVCNIAQKFEFLVVDKVERLEDNKKYLCDLKSNTTEETFKNILDKDLEMLKELESSKSSSRDFYFIISFRNADLERNKQMLVNIEQALENKGFTILETNKNVLKNMLQTYFERNFSGMVLKDFDI